MKSVLVVDDKELMRDSVCSTLRRAGFGVSSCCDGASALAEISRNRPDAVITDLKMPGLGGIELLEKIRQIDMDLPVVLMTAFGSVETAVQAIKLGAFDYITKPFEGDELVISIKRAIRQASLSRENAVLKASQKPAQHGNERSACSMDRLIGDSPAMSEIKRQIEIIAQSHGTVLLSGQTGTGKEVVARVIHDLSPRNKSAFLGVNCAALSASLLESELFGHEQGAFTGADRMRKGRFELAHQGTLLLDEVSEISPHLQSKLLRVLQERTLERVGSSVSMGVDVRIIATTNRRLLDSVAARRFREDLYFRLNVLPIHLPPLCDRVEDVPQLARHFVEEVAIRDGREAPVIDPDAMVLLQGYNWPGNVRELQNICERAVVLSHAGGGRIDSALIEPWLRNQQTARVAAGAGVEARYQEVRPSRFDDEAGALLDAWSQPKVGLDDAGLCEEGTLDVQVPTATKPSHVRTLEEIEREAIVITLNRYNGHRGKSARALGIGVRTLGLKLKKWKELDLVAQSL